MESVFEMKAVARKLSETNSNMGCTEDSSINTLILIEKMSSASKLFCVTGYVIRFVGNIKEKLENKGTIVGRESTS